MSAALAMPMLPLSDALVADLDRDGFAIARRAASAAHIARITAELAEGFAETAFSDGLFYGSRTVRFGRLLARSPATAALVQAPEVLDAVETVLGRSHSDIHLSFTQAIAVHPGSPSQAPHRDEDMWPCIKGDAEYLINVIWPLDPFTAENGATQVWRDSHRRSGRAAVAPLSAPEPALLQPGDALIFLGSTLHGAGANLTAQVRRALVFGYSAAWLVPSENPVLACPPDLARHLPPRVQALAGYKRIAPNLNNYDCRCPSEVLTGAPLANGAVDELHAWQVEALKAFNTARGLAPQGDS